MSACECWIYQYLHVVLDFSSQVKYDRCIRHGHAYYLEMAEAKFYTVYRMSSNYVQKTLDTLQHSTILANLTFIIVGVLQR